VSVAKTVKRAYRYRFYPSPGQETELLRTFGCVRKVWNLALDARSEAWYRRRERVSYVQSSAMLTEWKQSGELAYLNEVSSVPLQQALRHLQGAFANFYDKRAKYENQAVVIEDLSVRNMLGNHSLARAISDAAWGDLRGMLEYKCDWYGRDLIVIDRWYPSSKTCSACGHLAASLPLSVREWDCANCGTRHDRDINAAANIRAAGLAVLACGGSVRPKRESSRAGSSR
jgi:IS605 OrfB family transposase